LKLPKILTVKPLGDYRLWLTFSNGQSGEVNLDDVVGAPGLLGKLADRDLFGQVYVAGGTLEWPNGVDLDPIVLYCEATGTPIKKIIPWAEDFVKPNYARQK
jgi:hypothetical protein